MRPKQELRRLRTEMDYLQSDFKKYLARDRIINLRISKKEEVMLRSEAKRLSKSISCLIREGFLNYKE